MALPHCNVVASSQYAGLPCRELVAERECPPHASAGVCWRPVCVERSSANACPGSDPPLSALAPLAKLACSRSGVDILTCLTEQPSSVSGRGALAPSAKLALSANVHTSNFAT